MEVTEKDIQEAKQAIDPRVLDLLARVVNELLESRPPDAYDSLEQLVASLKNQDADVEEEQTTKIDIDQALLVQHLARSEEDEVQQMDLAWMDKQPQSAPWTDCREQMRLLRTLAGVCIPENTIFQLALAIRRLQQNFPSIYRTRFWGCICFKWYVVEAELTPQGFAARAEEIKSAEEEKKKDEKSDSPEVPTEPPGTGVNSMVYLVSEAPGEPDSWIWLPDLTPRDITLARQVVHYPPDLGATLDCTSLSPTVFLRAQITRINSSTRVAPQGMFKMKKKLAPGEVEEEDDEEDEEEEEEEEDEDEVKEARVNPRFKQPTLQQLLDQSQWVHITPNVLQVQSRVKWWNPNPDDDEDEDEDEDSDGPKRPGPEQGPKPLSPLSQDVAQPELVPGFQTCWTLRNVSVLGPPAVVARSLTWPGSITLYSAGRLEHVYVGWGTKSSSRHFCPELVPEFLPEPAELELAKDPSVEEEKAAAANEDEDQEDEED